MFKRFLAITLAAGMLVSMGACASNDAAAAASEPAAGSTAASPAAAPAHGPVGWNGKPVKAKEDIVIGVS